MSNTRSFLTVALLATPLLTGSAQLELVVIDPKAVARGYSGSKLIGETAINEHREPIGTINDLVITRADDDSDAFCGARGGRLSSTWRPSGGCAVHEPRVGWAQRQDCPGGRDAGGAQEAAGVPGRQLRTGN